MTKTTYWNHMGKYQQRMEMLQRRIPSAGKCSNPLTANKHLDRLRRGINCYYDLYNNGMGNRDNETKSVWGFRVGYRQSGIDQYVYDAVEIEMNNLVELAWQEQFPNLPL